MTTKFEVFPLTPRCVSHSSKKPSLPRGSRRRETTEVGEFKEERVYHSCSPRIKEHWANRNRHGAFLCLPNPSHLGDQEVAGWATSCLFLSCASRVDSHTKSCSPNNLFPLNNIYFFYIYLKILA